MTAEMVQGGPVPGAVNDVTTLELSDIQIPTPARSLDAYLARPRAVVPPRPGLVLVHEANGLGEHQRDLARRFANLGFVVIAPNLYTGQLTPDLGDIPGVYAAMLALSDEVVTADLKACADFLRELDGTSDRVGTIGFCSGGRHALIAACLSDTFDAVVDCWGGYLERASPDHLVTPNRPRVVLDMVAGLSAPLLVACGAADANPSPEHIGQLLVNLAKAGKSVTIKVFGDAGHAFLADSRPEHYRARPAHELWRDLNVFFDQHLRQGGEG